MVHLSLILIFLKKDVSTSTRPGPRNAPRDTLPKVPAVGITKAWGSNQRSFSLDFSSTKPTYTWWHLDGKLETVCSIGHHLRIEKIVQNADDVVGDVRRLAGAGRWRTKWTHAARWRRLGIMEGIGMGRRS